MFKFRFSTVFVVLTVFALVLGACASATPAPTATAVPAPTAVPTTLPNTGPTQAQVIMVSQQPVLGNLLTDTKGLTLYMFKKDAPGVSNCYDQCATSWPPLLVANGATPTAASGFTGTLGTTQRKDGTSQVTVNNMPVYYFEKDNNSGDANGQGIGKVWYVLDASGAIVTTPLVKPTSAPAAQGPVIMVAQNAALGNILTDAKGMTLYAFTQDTPGTSNCTGDSAGIWPPLVVAQGVTPTAGSGFSGTLGTIQRSDGTTQVTVNNQPVYTWVKDKNTGDTTGQGVGKVWFVLDATGKIVNTLLPSAAPTSAAQGPVIMVSDTANLGSILTDAKGMTLYVFTRDTAGVSNCYGTLAASWPPLLVTNGATPTAASGFKGTLGTIQRKDGSTQVTVNNMPVYYFAKDKNSGDTTGQGIGKVWYVIDASGTMMNK